MRLLIWGTTLLVLIHATKTHGVIFSSVGAPKTLKDNKNPLTTLNGKDFEADKYLSTLLNPSFLFPSLFLFKNELLNQEPKNINLINPFSTAHPKTIKGKLLEVLEEKKEVTQIQPRKVHRFAVKTQAAKKETKEFDMSSLPSPFHKILIFVSLKEVPNKKNAENEGMTMLSRPKTKTGPVIPDILSMMGLKSFKANVNKKSSKSNKNKNGNDRHQSSTWALDGQRMHKQADNAEKSPYSHSRMELLGARSGHSIEDIHGSPFESTSSLEHYGSLMDYPDKINNIIFPPMKRNTRTLSDFGAVDESSSHGGFYWKFPSQTSIRPQGGHSQLPPTFHGLDFPPGFNNPGYDEMNHDNDIDQHLDNFDIPPPHPHKKSNRNVLYKPIQETLQFDPYNIFPEQKDYFYD